MNILLNGKMLAEKIIQEIREECEKLEIRPRLGIVLVGDNPASQIYVKKKIENAEKAGMEAELFKLSENVSEREVLDLVRKLNNDEKIDGFIVQLPLPKQVNSEKVIESLDPKKDVDGFHPVNMGKVMAGIDGLRPATPSGIMRLLDEYNVNLEGANAVVVGRSNIVGKPIAMMLLQRNSTVSICHSKTKNIEEYTQNADVLVVAVGKPGLITKGMVKQGAYVVDVGTTRVDGKLKGDVCEDVKEKANLSPVPGGVGPLTVAMLLWNTLKAAKTKADK